MWSAEIVVRLNSSKRYVLVSESSPFHCKLSIKVGVKRPGRRLKTQTV